MRWSLCIGLIAGLFVTAPAQARTLPVLFAQQVRAINAAPHAPPVLLPRSMPLDATRVTVRGAAKAGFVALSCGASCSPPQIDFLVHGVRYTIQARLNTSRGDRAALIRAAEAAIGAGPR